MNFQKGEGAASVAPFFLMALFGSKKGLKWWGEVEKAKADLRKAEEKYAKKPTDENKSKVDGARHWLERIQVEYYD